MNPNTAYLWIVVTVSLLAAGCAERADREPARTADGNPASPAVPESEASRATAAAKGEGRAPAAKPAAGQGRAPAAKPAAGQGRAPAAKPAPGQGPASVVFVGQRDACDCTRARIDDSWAALQAALSERPEIPVQRIELDVDTELAEKLARLEALMVAPGIYFLDDSGGLMELLQGEVSEDQLLAVMAKGGR